MGGVSGTRFAVFAPNAMRVSVVGDFNNWDGRVHELRRMGDSGIFAIFLPGVEAGALYKYEIKTYAREILLRADPYARAVEAEAAVLPRWRQRKPPSPGRMRPTWKSAPCAMGSAPGEQDHQHL